MSKPRVLCFLDNPLGRDTEILLPVIYCIEKYLGAQVQTKFLWDILHIWIWKPDVILLPNIKGHHMYLEIAAFARKNNITVLALESEGNFMTDGSYNYWGYNKKKIVYQEWLTTWSERTNTYLKEIINKKDHPKLIVTGGTGFDRYIFEKFMQKDEFLTKYGYEKFDKVIGYAGWAFGKLYGSHKDQSFLHFKDWKPREEALRWVESQRKHVRDILETTINNSPDTLFIFKKHPKENFESDPNEGPNEMNELIHYDNVIYLKNEESIADLINVSDLWIAFESTTAVESWMLGKTTILINSEPDFPRSSPYQASVIVDNAKDLQNCINEHYSKGSIKLFLQKSKLREQAISNSIGYADGMNHLRAMFHFRKSIPVKHQKNRVSLNLRHLRLFLLMHLGRFFYNKSLFLRLPKFKKTVYVFENRQMPGFDERREICYEYLDKFHKKEGIDKELMENDWSRFSN